MSLLCTYPYECACGHKFEVTKKMSDIDKLEKCQNCDSLLNSSYRKIANRQIFYGTRVEDAEYCPALGCIVKNNKDRQRIAKSRGLIEIGNEDPNKLLINDDKMRDQRAKDRYKEFFDPIEVKSNARDIS